jgi:hypothetical protein
MRMVGLVAAAHDGLRSVLSTPHAERCESSRTEVRNGCASCEACIAVFHPFNAMSIEMPFHPKERHRAKVCPGPIRYAVLLVQRFTLSRRSYVLLVR